MNSGKTLEGKFLVDIVWSLDVQYYCCVSVVHVVPIVLCVCCIYGIVYI